MTFRLAVGVVLAVLATATNAAATSTDDGTAAIKLSTKKTHAPASLTVGGIFATGATGAQRVLTAITVVLPPGTKLNPAAVTLCPGDEASLAKMPGAAKKNCPAASQLGTGTARVLLGKLAAGFDITIWNQQAGPTLELDLNHTPTFMTHGELTGNRLTFPLPIAERISAATQAFELTFNQLGTSSKPYLQTPSTCPGRWRGGLAADVSGGDSFSIPASWGCRKS